MCHDFLPVYAIDYLISVFSVFSCLSVLLHLSHLCLLLVFSALHWCALS